MKSAYINLYNTNPFSTKAKGTVVMTNVTSMYNVCVQNQCVLGLKNLAVVIKLSVEQINVNERQYYALMDIGNLIK